MGMTTDGLSYWQAESEGIDLLDTTIGDLLDQRADELPTQEAVVYSCYPEFGDALNIRWTYQEYRERANAHVWCSESRTGAGDHQPGAVCGGSRVYPQAGRCAGTVLHGAGARL